MMVSLFPFYDLEMAKEVSERLILHWYLHHILKPFLWLIVFISIGTIGDFPLYQKSCTFVVVTSVSYTSSTTTLLAWYYKPHLFMNC